MEFFADPVYQGVILTLIGSGIWGALPAIQRIADNVAAMRANDDRRAKEESKYYMEALDREIARHDAHMARNND